MLIIIDTSVKNNIATLVSYIHRDQEIITKTIHHATNVNSTEAKLFAIRYKINHTTYLQNINYIIVITDAILAVKWIFNISIHPYQFHSIIILKDLKKFFNKCPNNFINFWDCLNSVKWSSHSFIS